MDNWPYWMFEENIKIVNEILEEENKQHQKQQEAQSQSMGNYDPSSMMKNVEGMTKNMPKY